MPGIGGTDVAEQLHVEEEEKSPQMCVFLHVEICTFTLFLQYRFQAKRIYNQALGKMGKMGASGNLSLGSDGWLY